MRIGWLIPGLGIYGSVREVIEISNVLAGDVLRHSVTIFHPGGAECEWLRTRAEVAPSEDVLTTRLDALIIVGLTEEHWELFKAAKPALKVVCIMGFDPDTVEETGLFDSASQVDKAGIFAEAFSGEYMVIADAPWQCAYLSGRLGFNVGPSIGGVNVHMFRAIKGVVKADFPTVIWSGDMRDRKGSETVKRAIGMIRDASIPVNLDSYWGKGIAQKDMAAFIGGADVFIDGHLRGGWCNPVAEAMACRVATVCTDIPAVSAFAIDGFTSHVVPAGDAEAMSKAITELLMNQSQRKFIAKNGYAMIQRYSYEHVAPVLGAALKTVLQGASD